jgi:DNA-directed RNA polymerase II subunit RPB1
MIRNGELLIGIIDKASVGPSSGGLIQALCEDFSNETASQFMNYMLRLTREWITRHGFSIGMRDVIAPPKVMIEIKNKIEQRRQDIAKFVAENNTSPTFETDVATKINQLTEVVADIIVKKIPNSNSLKQDILFGAKGNYLNMSQMIGMLGQQNVNNRRIPGALYRNRTLPMFAYGDRGMDAGGFVANSFSSGLNPHEFFFHAMAGREGLVDTAVKTSESGYIQRRLTKAMEDIQICYDGTARNSLKQIIQYSFGHQGF